MKWILILIPLLIIGLVFAFNFRKKPDKTGDYDIVETGGCKDYTDPDAPKIIESKEITSFEYSFLTADLNQWHNRHIPYERCAFKLTRRDEEVIYTGRGHSDYGGAFHFELMLPLSALDDLQERIDDNKVARVNGIYKKVIGIPGGCGACLSVKYASGESIFASDNSGPVLDSVTTLTLYDFFLALAKSLDDKLIYTDEEFWAISDFLTGPFESKERKTLLNFQERGLGVVEIYEDGDLVEDERYSLEAGKISNSSSDAAFGAYMYFELGEDQLFGIKSDGSKVEFIKTE